MVKCRPVPPSPRKERRPEYGRPNHPHEVTTLLPPSCARCGAPLPAVAADPTHPEWCGACAARALDAPGMVPPSVPSSSARGSQAPWSNPTTSTAPEPAGSLVVKTRVLDGILTGLAAATLAGVLWWAAVWAIGSNDPTFDQWHIGSIVVGFIVGQGVLLGSRRGGLVSGLLALLFTLVAVLVAVYFIDRSLTIAIFEDRGRTSDVSLWLGFTYAEDLYRSYAEFDRSHALQWLLGPLVAVLIAGWSGRRPLAG